MVDQLQAEARVDLRFADRVGSSQNIDETPQIAQGRCQAVTVEETGPGNREPREPVLQLSLPALFLAHPTRDEHRVSAGFQGCTVASQLPITFSHLPLDGLSLVRGRGRRFVRCHQEIQGAVDVRRSEQASQPAIELGG
ncbi:hypothetical protein ACIHFD_43535 [Nonomuraea sp. NPDC051941]|uniref:hypothetical protein n=1 Tax=Nonomuraea sp. NPDC051941 TaxID=3364373 RepID=UPI0037C89705